jgi:membrane protein DedA with SNARE-associated domain
LVSHVLQSIPPEAVYLIVGLMIMVESLGIPVPGEIALVTAAVLATQHKMALSPAWIAVAASAGAITGDSIGFLIGRRAGSSAWPPRSGCPGCPGSGWSRRSWSAC